MRLIECYIENFGKICKQSFTFKEGFNCICRENGEGKTTLSVFIKVMLFGMSDTKKTSLFENDRRRYLPWHGGSCGGYIIFSVGKKKYRAERTFAPKAADDTFTLYDLSTGKVSEDYSENLGEELFGIDVDGFERTVFLSERALSVKSENKSISAKLSDLVGTDGDIGVMDDAMKVLEEQRRFYQKRGGSGKISELRGKITEVEMKLGELAGLEERLAESEAEAEGLRKGMAELNNSASALMTERGEAMVARSRSESAGRHKSMRAELAKLVERKDALIEFFGGNPPAYAELDQANLSYLRAKQLRDSADKGRDDEELARLDAIYGGEKSLPSPAELGAAVVRSNRRAEAMSQRESYSHFKLRVPDKSEIENAIGAVSRKRQGLTALPVLAAIFAVLGIVGGILVSPYIFIAAAVGVMLGIAYAVRGGKGDEVEKFFLSVCGEIPRGDERIKLLLDMNAHLSETAKDMAGADEDEALIKRFLDGIGIKNRDTDVNISDLAKEYERYDRLRAEVAFRQERSQATVRETEQLSAVAEGFLKRFKTVSADPFSEIRAAVNEYTALTAKIVTYRGELENTSLDTEGEGSPKRTIEEIDRKRQEIELAREAKQRELGALMRRREDWETTLLDKDMLTAQLVELRERLAEAEETLSTVVLTQKYLCAARDSITAKYLGKTKDSFEKYAAIISGSEAEYGMDTSFGVTRLDSGAARPTDAYSRGTRDLFGLAARLALTDSLYDGERPFIILDDPFCTFDDERCASALGVLNRLSADRQIIYFTCSESRAMKN